MKISDAIRQARILRDTEIPDRMLIQWLSALDGQLWEDVVSRYEGASPAERPAYADNADPETVLLVQAPYDELYPTYLAMRIDLAHEDIDRYNNEAVTFGRQRNAWSGWYNRNHRWAASKQRMEPRPTHYDTQILF